MASCHNFLYRGLSSVVIVVKEVIVVKVICFVDSYHNFIITAFAIVPADLRSAGIEYKDLQSDYFLFCHCIIYTSLKSAVLLTDQKLAALTFGSDIIFRQIFRSAQQLVQISRHIRSTAFAYDSNS